MEVREEKIGITLGRFVYSNARKGRPYTDYEDDILLAHINKTDVGNANHSREFARLLVDSIHEEMFHGLKNYVSSPLQLTERLPPVAVITDKVTIQHRTCQLHGLILVVPDSPNLLQPVFIDMPTVRDHSGLGIAKLIASSIDRMGISQTQISGVGVDGQYIKLGVEKHLRNLSFMPLYSNLIWDPAHKLNLADTDARNETPWVKETTSVVSDVFRLVNYGKHYEELLEMAGSDRILTPQFYSSTRFAPHAAKVYRAFLINYKYLVPVVQALCTNM
jgi:hypothetical protein